MREYLSMRAWIMFVGAEALLAGVLWLIGLLTPLLLVATGVALLFVLWIWDHKPKWAPKSMLIWLDLLDAKLRGISKPDAKIEQATPTPDEVIALVAQLRILGNINHGHHESRTQEAIEFVAKSQNKIWMDQQCSSSREKLVQEVTALQAWPHKATVLGGGFDVIPSEPIAVKSRRKKIAARVEELLVAIRNLGYEV